jgi:hypothetical protein
MLMRGTLVAVISGSVLALVLATPALCEDLVGTVANSGGQAVQGVKVIVHSSDGQITEAATTDASGSTSYPVSIPASISSRSIPPAVVSEGRLSWVTWENRVSP